LPGNSLLVLTEPNPTTHIGTWEVFNGNTTKSGTYTDTQEWNLGADVTQPLAVHLVLNVDGAATTPASLTSINTFTANNVCLSGLAADPRYALVHRLGIAIGQASTENLGDTTKKGFAPPVKNTFAWWGGAVNIVGTGSVTPALQTPITQNNLQFNGSLGTSADTVFARTYDRYLVANKGSSVDNVFIDYNNAGDWTYGGGSGAFTAGDIATPGFKNTVFNGNRP